MSWLRESLSRRSSFWFGRAGWTIPSLPWKKSRLYVITLRFPPRGEVPCLSRGRSGVVKPDPMELHGRVPLAPPHLIPRIRAV